MKMGRRSQRHAAQIEHRVQAEKTKGRRRWSVHITGHKRSENKMRVSVLYSTVSLWATHILCGLEEEIDNSTGRFFTAAETTTLSSTSSPGH
ncbi:hypothetical protein INR49_010956 [Caranx melampygus]|nr:hypothetical protein INR49_010956 [Caranx melampygus]